MDSQLTSLLGAVDESPEAPAAAQRRKRLDRLRRLLRARGVAGLKVIYCAFDGVRFVTICAWSDDARLTRLGVPKAVRSQVVHFFLAMVTQRYPTWVDGDDAGGVFDWDLLTNTLEQRHTGARILYEKNRIQGL